MKGNRALFWWKPLRSCTPRNIFDAKTKAGSVSPGLFSMTETRCAQGIWESAIPAFAVRKPAPIK